jgi:hypothetical protein
MQGRGHAEDASGVPNIHGSLESHLTVSCRDRETERLAVWAARRGFGFSHILLARGEKPSQPMLNFQGEGAALGQVRMGLDLAHELGDHGFRVVRVKTEAAPWASGVPQHDTDALATRAELHFEHHVKLLLPADHDRARLEAAVLPHTAHLSWNARRFRADDREERFVTQRCHRVGRATAERCLTALLETLRAEEHHVLEVEREYVLHDTNLGLDDGWITRENRR